PGLAKRIVADRDASGPFGSLDGLDRVPGVGPSLLAGIRDHVSFSDSGAFAGQIPPLQPHAPRLVSLNRASAAELEALPGIGARRAEGILLGPDGKRPLW